MDVHEDIHRVAESYYDAEEFRRSLNSAIQNSRGVSFLLQKQKSRWTDFDEWYGPWQADARRNTVMSWGVNSRNRIVKEEDLATRSMLELIYYGPRLSQAEDAVLVPPLVTPEQMVGVFADLIAKQKHQGTGTIRVVRKWIDDRLPQYELGAALRELYAGVARLIDIAHQRSGIVGDCAATGFRRPCVTAHVDPRLPCMPPGPPSASIDIATRAISRVEYRSMPWEESAVPRLIQKYGKPQVFGRGPLDDAYERLSMSKVFLENDGFTSTTIYFYRGRDIVRAAPLNIRLSSPRELAVQLALENLGAEEFDGALFATEMWIGGTLNRADGLINNATTPGVDEAAAGQPQPFYDADPVGGRPEALAVYAVTADQGARSLLVQYRRAGSHVNYTPLLDSPDPRFLPPMLLRPLLRHWVRARKSVDLVPKKEQR